MSEIGTPVIQCRRCGWQPKSGDQVCEQCSALLGAPAEAGPAAGRGRRIAGALIDALIAGVPALIGWLIWAGDFADDGTLTDRQQVGLVVASALGFSLWSLLVLGLAGRRQSPGKALLGMTVVHLDGRPVTALLFAARHIVWWLAINACFWASQIPGGDDGRSGLGFAGFVLLLVDVGMLLFSRNRQSVHDKIFKTTVIGTQPIFRTIAVGTQQHDPPAQATDTGRSDAVPGTPEPLPADEAAAAETPAPEPPGLDASPAAAEPRLHEQLDELERLRDYLTPEQYERRRRSILGISDEDAGR